MTAVLVIVSVVALVALDALLLWLRGRKAVPAPVPLRPFASVHLPRGLFLGSKHTWARLTESGELRLGADELLAQAIGGSDRVEMRGTGEEVQAGDVVATVWRMGRRLELRTPVGGTVMAGNPSLRQSPGLITADPYGSGWLVSVWPVEHGEALRSLRVGEAARRWLEREVQRFAEFLGAATRPAVLGEVVADGAVPVVGSALSLGDEEWRDFDRQFAGGA